MGVLMVWGTTLLYIDSLAIIIIYERLGNLVGRSLVPRFFIAGVITLTFDQVGFFGALHYLVDAPASVFWAGLFGKISMAVVYAAVTAVYLVLTYENRAAVQPRSIADLLTI